VVLRPLARWECGFASRRFFGCPSLVSVVCSQIDVSALGWSPFQRSSTDCGVSECDREATITRRSWFTRGCCAMKNKVEFYEPKTVENIINSVKINTKLFICKFLHCLSPTLNFFCWYSCFIFENLGFHSHTTDSLSRLRYAVSYFSTCGYMS
jgi:hypothetical protein